MAKIRGQKAILKSDVPDAPDWFTPVISILNQFLNTVVSGLRQRLTFAENFYGEIKSFNFTHGEELEVATSLGSYSGLLILKTPDSKDSGLIVTGYKARQVKPNTLGVTVNFAGSSGTVGTVTFIILG
jgi:hypothetical protein